MFLTFFYLLVLFRSVFYFILYFTKSKIKMNYGRKERYELRSKAISFLISTRMKSLYFVLIYEKETKSRTLRVSHAFLKRILKVIY